MARTWHDDEGRAFRTPANGGATERVPELDRDPLDDDRGTEPIEFTESPRGDAARERWARRYDDLNGAPEGDGDR